jgi:hypothetical protein
MNTGQKMEGDRRHKMDRGIEEQRGGSSFNLKEREGGRKEEKNGVRTGRRWTRNTGGRFDR